jgi:hypothetical protein
MNLRGKIPVLNLSFVFSDEDKKIFSDSQKAERSRKKKLYATEGGAGGEGDEFETVYSRLARLEKNMLELVEWLKKIFFSLNETAVVCPKCRNYSMQNKVLLCEECGHEEKIIVRVRARK